MGDKAVSIRKPWAFECCCRLSQTAHAQCDGVWKGVGWGVGGGVPAAVTADLQHMAWREGMDAERVPWVNIHERHIRRWLKGHQTCHV